ncbi:hypothetical protein TL16_g08624 [Triparma laevis f. inornata]|uniref:Uncharacterized protein n=1 Tax=Triparma laevis f. inornata TaxID=1714386 RepID=A0A9W7B678_9STRA|nr:hypothetical protein TL16_g08624 [Triparma laevis f. inornata]
MERATSSIPLENDLEVLVNFLREVMKPRALAATLPKCDKSSNLALVDCVVLARAFDFLAKTASGSNEDAVGENSFRNASLISLLSNIFLQLIMVFFQNKKQKSKSRLFKGLLYVLSTTKPGVDAYRVVIGAEQVGAPVDPKVEMMFTKMLELFCEAIPGALIQSYAFLVGSNQSNAAIFSLIVSVFTASFTATGISFNTDVDKNKRAHTPDFYGYVPDGAKKKVKVFMNMFLISACQLSAKVLACALCAVESGTIVAFYLK